jgi:hypothetical protein
MVLAAIGPDMPTEGWRLKFAADLQHWSAVVGDRLGWLPGWALLVAAAGGAALLAWRRRSRHRAGAEPPLAQPVTVTASAAHQRGRTDA